MITYNIRFPLNDDLSKNTYFSMTTATKDAFSSNLLLLLLTQKGERYYDPNYGTDLLKFIFEPNDGITISDIEEEIRNTVARYIPNLTINSITFNDDHPDNDVRLNVNIKFTYEEDAFSEAGELDIQF